MTVHDVMFMMPDSEIPSSSDMYHALGAVYRRMMARTAASRAAAIITVSSRSAQDIQKYLRVPRDRINIIYEAPQPAFKRIDALLAADCVRAAGVHSEFILTLGGVDPRKNTRGVIEAFAMAKKARARGLKLVIVGLTSRSIPVFAAHAARCGVSDEVIFFDFVPEETLVAMYNRAELFLYLSRYEGFGLPLLEAMACGAPVIASAAGSIPEIAGDAALLVSPADQAIAARAIERVIEDHDLREELVRRGERRTRLFSWKRAASETLEVYERCLQA